MLLIDADMRRPVIAKMFGIDPLNGLSDYLHGGVNVSDLVVASEVPGLDVMPNGGATGEPAELLESHRLRSLLQEASKDYDLVLFDAPPLLAVADPAIIAPYVDCVLLTVRVIKNGRGSVEDAVRILTDIQIAPTGVLVNGVDNKVRSSYTYGGYTKSGYGYVGHYHNHYSARPGPAGKRTEVLEYDSKHGKEVKPSFIRGPHDRESSDARPSLVSVNGKERNRPY